MKRVFFVGCLLVVCLILGQQKVQATEGGSSYYFPGANATFLSAVAPSPGFMRVNQMLFYNGKADRTVLGGAVHLNLKANGFYNYVGGAYTFEKPVFGSKLQIGLAVPLYGKVNIDGTAVTNLGNRSVSDDSSGIGDSILSAALYWKKGDFNYKAVETIFVPSGKYEDGQPANVGRNYWGFDTTLVMTRLKMQSNMKTGTEFTIAPGILFNTKNNDSDYKSGSEFHFDFALNRHYFTQNYALGIQGYYYRQISGDSGSGARLGSFKGEAFGIGPAFLWTPKAYKGQLAVLGKWLFDVSHQNRMHGDYGQLIITYQF